MRATTIIVVLSTLLAVWAAAVRTVAAADSTFAAPAPSEQVDEGGVQFFDKNIRPLLVEHCFACHSAGAVKLRGELLLDSRQGVVKGGQRGPVIVAGEPDKSRLIRAIRWTDPELQMPPTKQLSAEQIEKLEQWVKMGAPDPREEGSNAATRPLTAEEAGRTWWALQPVVRPDVPDGVTESANPIDAFVAAEHRSQGLTPVGSASKTALLRRVYLDLVGIPPTPAEQEAFLNDPSPGAYEKVVDHLLGQ
jgi:mono/diheme cytochrome c family protein